MMNIPNNNKDIESITISNGTKTIKSDAFLEYENLKTIILHKNIENVETGAFSVCDTLERIIIPFDCPALYQLLTDSDLNISNTVFIIQGCTKSEFREISPLKLFDELNAKNRLLFSILSKEDIPDKAIESYKVPEYVDTIASKTFICCESLTRVTFPTTLKRIDSMAFFDCTSLESLDIPEGVEYIGNNVFDFCESLKRITLPSTIKKIGDYAFKCCKSLEIIVIPEGITELGNYMFWNCTNLKSVSFPSTLEFYNSSIFDGYEKIQRVEVPIDCPALLSILSDKRLMGNKPEIILNPPIWTKTNLDYEEIVNAIKKLGITRYRFAAKKEKRTQKEITLINSAGKKASLIIDADVNAISADTIKSKEIITEISLPYGIVEINQFAFEGQTELKKIVLPMSLTTIHNNAFMGCTSLTEVALPERTQKVGNEAYKGCLNLKKVSLPRTLISFGDDVFTSCSNLEEISIPANNPRLIAILKKIHDSNTSPTFTITYTDESQMIIIMNDPYISSLQKEEKLVFKSIEPKRVKIPEAFMPEAFGNRKPLDFSGLPRPVETIIDVQEKHIVIKGHGTSTLAIMVKKGHKIDRKRFEDLLNLKTEDVYEMSIPSVITNINASAFKGWFPNLKKVTFFRQTIQTIEESAFEDCVSLNAIILPAGLKKLGKFAFRNCVNLTRINFPSSLEEIEKGAFDNCCNLTDIVINLNWPFFQKDYESFKKILSSLPYIKNIIINTTQEELDKMKELIGGNLDDLISRYNVRFLGDVDLRRYKLPEKAVEPGTLSREMILRSTAQARGRKLKSCKLPNTHTIIGEAAFYGQTELKYIKLPDTLKRIKVLGFYGCKSLEAIDFPTSVAEIESNAFKGCTSLKKITFSSSLKSINPNAFEDCSSVEKIVVPLNCECIRDILEIEWPNNVSFQIDYESQAEKNKFYQENAELLRRLSLVHRVNFNNPKQKEISQNLVLSSDEIISPSEEYSIPDGVIIIDKQAFTPHKHIKRIDLPTSVHFIEDEAFEDCAELEEVSLNTNINRIGNKAFKGCTSLRKIAIQGKIEIIEKDTFKNCTNLEEVYLPSTITHIEEGAFENCTSLQIIKIPRNVESIGKDAFTNDTALKKLILPNGIMSISPSKGCEALEVLSLPASIGNISQSVLNGFPNLKRLMIRYRNPSELFGFIDSISSTLKQSFPKNKEAIITLVGPPLDSTINKALLSTKLLFTNYEYQTSEQVLLQLFEEEEKQQSKKFVSDASLNLKLNEISDRSDLFSPQTKRIIGDEVQGIIQEFNEGAKRLKPQYGDVYKPQNLYSKTALFGKAGEITRKLEHTKEREKILKSIKRYKEVIAEEENLPIENLINERNPLLDQDLVLENIIRILIIANTTLRSDEDEIKGKLGAIISEIESSIQKEIDSIFDDHFTTEMEIRDYRAELAVDILNLLKDLIYSIDNLERIKDLINGINGAVPKSERVKRIVEDINATRKLIASLEDSSLRETLQGNFEKSLRDAVQIVSNKANNREYKKLGYANIEAELLAVIYKSLSIANQPNYVLETAEQYKSIVNVIALSVEEINRQLEICIRAINGDIDHIDISSCKDIIVTSVLEVYYDVIDSEVAAEFKSKMVDKIKLDILAYIAILARKDECNKDNNFKINTLFHNLGDVATQLFELKSDSEVYHNFVT